jgi:hypothetical protein
MFKHYSKVVSTLALFVALGGTTYAALALPANSVTTVQVKNGSLMKRDFRAGQLPAGTRGAPGFRGATGVAGAPGISGLVTANNSGQYAAALCPVGKVALGGGAHALGAYTALVSSEPTADGKGWQATATNLAGTSSALVYIYAVCATVAG